MPLRVLVIARWYPAVDDPVRGSFVADQVAALAAAGAVEPAVASFEFVRLNRVAERREPERAAIHERYAPAVGRSDVLVRGGWPAIAGTWPALSEVAVARLPVASGPDDPPAREADDHLAAFEPFLEALVAGRDGETASVHPGPAFDIVHGHTGFPDGVVAARAARRLGVPYVITEHSSRTGEILGDPSVRRQYADALAGASRVLVVSEALAAELRAALPELAPALDERLRVVANAVPVELFRAPPIAARATGTLLYVGSRKADKGIATLLEAFSLARAHRPGLSLRLIGRSPTDEDEARWRAMTEDLGVGDAVTFEPATDRAGVADAMAIADVFVHPSRRETFGVAAAEALAAGLPVVATASGGVEEILGTDPGAVGAVVPVDDPPTLAAGVLEVLRRRDEFEPDALRAYAVERFAANRVAERIAAIYAEAIEEAGTAPSVSGAALPARHAPAPVASEVPRAATDVTPADAPRPPAETVVAPANVAHSFGQTALADGRQLPIVVAFNRVRAGRLLSPLPARLRSRLTLVTADTPADQLLPEGLDALVEVDLDAGYRAALDAARTPEPPRGLLGRALRFARDPGASERVAGIHARRTELRLETARGAVRDAACASTAPGAGGPVRDAERSRTDPLAGGAVRDAAGDSDGHEAAVDVVCLDGYDVLAAGPAIDAGVARLAPGCIRWLADGWAAGRYSRPPATSRPISET